MSDTCPPPPYRTKAAVRRSRGPGWIWAIPVAVLLLLVWLGVRELTRGGEDITISFDDVHGLKQGETDLVYRGMNVGKVSDMALAKDGNSVDVTVHVDASAVGFLRSGTRFWLRGANPSLSDLSSLSAVLSGPTIVMDPGPGQPEKHFVGLTSQPVISGTHEPPQIYEAPLDGSVGRLKSGDPVRLRGFTVGEVKDVGFRYDASTDDIRTPVTLALYPSLFHIEGSAASDSGTALTAAIQRLVQQGWRVRLQRDPPLVGNAEVTLDHVPDGPSATLATVNGVPQLPAASEGGVESIVNRVNKVPVDQIGQNLLDVTRRLDALVSSSKLEDVIQELDDTVQQIRQAVHDAAPQITGLVTSLRKTAGDLDSAARTAKNLLGGASSQNGTQQALTELIQAARSVRDLADYLDRHPEAIIRGRSRE